MLSKISSNLPDQTGWMKTGREDGTDSKSCEMAAFGISGVAGIVCHYFVTKLSKNRYKKQRKRKVNDKEKKG
jgi:hypothetical protein